jgi:chromosome segregation ATPase
MEALLRTLDARTLRMEQILPTLATKVELRDLGETVAGLDTRLGRVEVRLERVEGRLESVEVRLDSVEGRLERVEVRLDGVEARLGRVEDRLGRVEDTQHRLLILAEDTRGDVRLLAEHVASALERIPRPH